MEDKYEDDEQIQKPKKKPRSEKQIESFKKAQQVRIDKAVLKKQKIKEVKDAINTTPLNELKPEELADVKPKRKQAKPVQPPLDESSEEEEEEIIFKKKKSKKKKTIIFEESPSSSEDDVPPLPTKPASKRKSIVEQPQPKTNQPPQIIFF
jgi:hypothetical protein